MKALREIFLNLDLSSKFKKDLLLLELLQKNWKEIVDKEFSSKAIPVLIQDETLWIEVSDHYILQILSGKTLDILEKIKKFLPEKFTIKKIRFKINPSLGTFSENKKKIKSFSNSQNLKKFLNFCEEIKDPELKKLFIRMFKSYVRLKKS